MIVYERGGNIHARLDSKRAACRYRRDKAAIDKYIRESFKGGHKEVVELLIDSGAEADLGLRW